MEVQSFDAFADAIRRAGVTHVVERVIREIRPRAGEGTSVIVEQVHRVEFLAYRDGVVFRCALDGTWQSGCEQALADMHIAVKKVSGNIT